MTGQATSTSVDEARFRFGKNWSRFLAVLNEERIARAEQSLRSMLGIERLDGQRFLDVGSGSGLFSLAARRLGATVHSFDYDPESVACTAELRRRYFPDDPEWTVEQGSALDAPYLESLGLHDIVYSWGVLHHTGAMWSAIDTVRRSVRDGGLLYIAIYNDKGGQSRRWYWIKRTYCALPPALQPVLAVIATVPRDAKHLGRSLLRLRPQDYVREWTRYGERRGMSRWHDIVDWVGGYPYEYASSVQITEFLAARGFSSMAVKRTNGLGCNEFVFRNDGGPPGG